MLDLDFTSGMAAREDYTARASAAANKADIAALNASQTAQDTLLANSATKAEIAALDLVIDKLVTDIALDGTGENWVLTFEDASTKTVARQLPASTRHWDIQRADDVVNVTPTVTETRTAAVNGDTAQVYLTDGSVEHWRHNGAAWLLSFTEAAPNPDVPLATNTPVEVTGIAPLSPVTSTGEYTAMYVPATGFTPITTEYLSGFDGTVTVSDGGLVDYTVPLAIEEGGVIDVAVKSTGSVVPTSNHIVSQAPSAHGSGADNSLFNLNGDFIRLMRFALTDGVLEVKHICLTDGDTFSPLSTSINVTLEAGATVQTRPGLWGDTSLQVKQLSYADLHPTTGNDDFGLVNRRLWNSWPLGATEKTEVMQTIYSNVVPEWSSGPVAYGNVTMGAAIEAIQYVTRLGFVYEAQRVSIAFGTDPATDDGSNWKRVGPQGLRGVPVADLAELTALAALDFETRKVATTGDVYVFSIGTAPTADNPADDAGTGAWIKQASVVAPSQRSFDALDETDAETFTNGELIVVGSDQYVFQAGAANGDYENNGNGLDGFLSRVGEKTEFFTVPSYDVGEPNVSFSPTDANYDGGPYSVTDTAADLYYVRRPRTAGARLRFDGMTLILEANDFDWHLFRRIDTSTVEYVGQIDPGMEPTGVALPGDVVNGTSEAAVLHRPDRLKADIEALIDEKHQTIGTIVEAELGAQILRSAQTSIDVLDINITAGTWLISAHSTVSDAQDALPEMVISIAGAGNIHEEARFNTENYRNGPVVRQMSRPWTFSAAATVRMTLLWDGNDDGQFILPGKSTYLSAVKIA